MDLFRVRLATALFGVIAMASGVARSDIITFSDSTFAPSDYLQASAVSAAGISVTRSQCASCGVAGGQALNITANIPGPNGQARLGVVNTGFFYNPLASGAITSIDASVDKNLIFAAQDLGGYPGPFSNAFRPLIVQGGQTFAATIFGPNLVSPGSTGYQSIALSGLLATDFLQFDYSTGLFGSANPDFSGGAMYFGLLQVSNVGTGFNFTNTTITGQYDNLVFTLTTVPEPGTASLVLLAFAGVLLARAGRLRLSAARGRPSAGA